jgi:hypothetical protein
LSYLQDESCYHSAAHTDECEAHIEEIQCEGSNAADGSDSGAEVSECGDSKQKATGVVPIKAKNPIIKPEKDLENLNPIKIEEEPIVEMENSKHSIEEELHIDIDNSSSCIDEDKEWAMLWAEQGERVVWQSWVQKYGDYIRPEFLGRAEHLAQLEFIDGVDSSLSSSSDSMTTVTQITTSSLDEELLSQSVPSSGCDDTADLYWQVSFLSNYYFNCTTVILFQYTLYPV